MPDDTCTNPDDWDATPVAILHRQAIMAAVLAIIFAVAAVRGLVRLIGRALQRARLHSEGTSTRKGTTT